MLFFTKNVEIKQDLKGLYIIMEQKLNGSCGQEHEK
jgi:hypothetical protein